MNFFVTILANVGLVVTITSILVLLVTHSIIFITVIISSMSSYSLYPLSIHSKVILFSSLIKSSLSSIMFHTDPNSLQFTSLFISHCPIVFAMFYCVMLPVHIVPSISQVTHIFASHSLIISFHQIPLYRWSLRKNFLTSL